MNVEKYTKNSLEAVRNAQNIAEEYGSQEIKQEHILFSLLTIEDSLILNLLKKINESSVYLVDNLKDIIEKMPKIYSANGGAVGQVYVSQDTANALNEAEKIAERMKDEYVSVEHIFMGLIEKANSNLKELFKKYNIDKDAFLKALSEVRGNTRVTSDNPEGTYDVLKKYGQDLTKMAREQKLDPVIGRDDEIRSVIRILSRKTKNNPCLIGEPGVRKNSNCRRFGP